VVIGSPTKTTWPARAGRLVHFRDAVWLIEPYACRAPAVGGRQPAAPAALSAFLAELGALRLSSSWAISKAMASLPAARFRPGSSSQDSTATQPPFSGWRKLEVHECGPVSDRAAHAANHRACSTFPFFERTASERWP